MGKRKAKNLTDLSDSAVKHGNTGFTSALTAKKEAIEVGTSDEGDRITRSQRFLSKQNPFPGVDRSLKLKVSVPMVSKKKRGRCKSEPQRCGLSAHPVRPRKHIKSESGQLSFVMERAKKLQASLDAEFPSFIKLMLRSHVTKGFWLGLPAEFCRSHMPEHDEIIILEGETGVKYKINYIAARVGLSGGWRGFSIAHRLLEGDVVVFHLIQPCKFKVYTVRADWLAEIDGALCLLNLDACAATIDEDCMEDAGECGGGEDKYQRFLSPDIPQENIENNSLPMTYSSPERAAQESEDGRKDKSSEEVGNFRSLESFANFENFTIAVNGFIVDPELSELTRTKYYELCSIRSSNLHNHLLSSVNCKLAAGIISETVNIADAIRASKVSSCLNDFVIWGKTLEAFETLGMDVGFLRERLNRLAALAFELREGVYLKRYREATLEKDHAEEEMRTLKVKLEDLTQAKNRLDDELEALGMKTQRYATLFQEVVNAPW